MDNNTKFSMAALALVVSSGPSMVFAEEKTGDLSKTAALPCSIEISTSIVIIATVNQAPRAMATRSLVACDYQ